MVLDRIAGRRTELTGEAELLRKQLDDAERELERLVIAEQVITQLTADGTVGGEPAGAGPAQRGFGLLVLPRSQGSGPGDLPDQNRLRLDRDSNTGALLGGITSTRWPSSTRSAGPPAEPRVVR